ncbi:MAG: YcdB/YcdC domain-containing protein [Bacillota bacterium]
MDKGLENAIRIAKAKFAIPDEYKFSSSISTSGNKQVYRLSWNSRDPVDATQIYVSIDENGMIIEYGKYSLDDYRTEKKLTKLSRQEARDKAEAYIELIAPGLLKELREEDNYYQGNIMDSSYYFNYYRVVDGIPFYNDRVYLNINRDTGALRNYSRQWSDIKSFPPPDAVLSIKEAEQAYAANLGMRLVYKYTKKDNALNAYLAYVPVYENSRYGVDAFTGERRKISGDNYGFYATADAAAGMQKQAILMAAGEGGVQLSPEELEAVREAAKLISREDAEKIARRAEYLEISENHKLQTYSLNTVWPEENKYVWSLYFRKQSEEMTTNDYVYVTIDAKTGEITGFFRIAPEPASAAPKKSVAAVKAEVDAFLRKYYPKYFSQLEYDKIASEDNITGTTPERQYNLVYTRLVNGIPFPGNGINIYYDNINGMIANFSLNWYDIGFPEDQVIGTGAACQKLFENVGLELQYKFDYQEAVRNIYPPEVPENAKAMLVYVLKSGKPLIIGANSGKLLNDDGTEYKEPVRVSYTDIKGNAAEKQITALAENGIHLGGTEFKPNELITQLDFLVLLSKTMNYYEPIIVERTEEDINRLYAYMMREGVIKEGERAPDNNVTREEAVKYMIRALKFDRVADIKGIFNISFKDKSSISPGLEGYAVIAAGLGIVEGGSVDFRPKDKITRGESAVMIYNYLQI